jgi:hypothetical protein
VHRGIEMAIHLRAGLPEEGYVALAIGNLAAFRLERQREEKLLWQVIRVDSPGGKHHYRLVIRHPDRVLDVGLTHDLSRQLDELSAETVDELRSRFEAAQREGLRPVPLRHLTETVDFWKDDFWNWFG